MRDADTGRLLCSDPARGAFSADEVEGLPPPVQRYFMAAIEPGTPLATSVRLRMHGRVRIGRWLPFRAREALAPHLGFVWSGRALGIITGSESSVVGVGRMRWRVAGLADLARGTGSDLSVSADGRAALEAIWLPTALLPRFGVTWTADDDEHLTARLRIGTTPVELRLTIDAAGLVRSADVDRWGDPDDTGRWGWHRFGGEISAYRTFGGLTIPSGGRFGWHVGNHRWADSVFLRYEIDELEPTRPTGGPPPVAPPPDDGSRAQVALVWIPLGAGQRVVRLSGRLVDRLSVAILGGERHVLVHSALVVTVPEGRTVIEMAPAGGNRTEHGVVAHGPVGLRWLGRARVFRYEIRRWRGGELPDQDAAEATLHLDVDLDVARSLLALAPAVPTPTWGRDELGTGETWNSNSVTSWLLHRSGIDTDELTPPPGARAPGWNAGLVVASRDLRLIAGGVG